MCSVFSFVLIVCVMLMFCVLVCMFDCMVMVGWWLCFYMMLYLSVGVKWLRELSGMGLFGVGSVRFVSFVGLMWLVCGVCRLMVISLLCL